MAFCDLFCGLIYDCLWNVQRIVLGAIWIKKSGLLRGCLGPILWPVKGLFGASFMTCLIACLGLVLLYV